MALRRIAYNLLAPLKVGMALVEETSATWKDLMRWLYNAAIAVTGDELQRLRPRAAVRS